MNGKDGHGLKLEKVGATLLLCLPKVLLIFNFSYDYLGHNSSGQQISVEPITTQLWQLVS